MRHPAASALRHQTHPAPASPKIVTPRGSIAGPNLVEPGIGLWHNDRVLESDSMRGYHSARAFQPHERVRHETFASYRQRSDIAPGGRADQCGGAGKHY